MRRPFQQRPAAPAQSGAVHVFTSSSHGCYASSRDVAGTIKAWGGDMMGGETLVCHYVCAPLWRGLKPVALTNSNGGHVIPTISASEYKATQNYKTEMGGYVMHRFAVGKEARQ